MTGFDAQLHPRDDHGRWDAKDGLPEGFERRGKVAVNVGLADRLVQAERRRQFGSTTSGDKPDGKASPARSSTSPKAAKLRRQLRALPPGDPERATLAARIARIEDAWRRAGENPIPDMLTAMKRLAQPSLYA